MLSVLRFTYMTETETSKSELLLLHQCVLLVRIIAVVQ